MQIKFLTLYHDFDDHDGNLCDAQDSLLYMWQRSIQLKQVKFIPTAKVEFKEYSFFDYPDQEKAKRELSNAYGYRLRKDGSIIYSWGGKEYSDIDSIYNALAKQKRLMELIITVDDEDYV